MQEILSYHLAGYPVLFVLTQEPHRAERELSALFSAANVPAYRWDVVDGGPVPLFEGDGAFVSSTQDPVEVINAFTGLEGGGVLFLWHYHHFLGSPEVQQAILNAILPLQRGGKMLIILAPSVQIPPEIEKVVTVVDFRLPTEDDLRSFLKTFCEVKKTDLAEEQAEAIVRAGLGLTKAEFMSALALSFERRGGLDVADVLEQKAQLVRKNDVLEFFKPSEEDRFSMIGGLENLKVFLKATAEHPLARGVLLLGVPGTGKSAVAKALGNETGLPVLALDFGRAFGSLVGESEARIRAALKVVDAMAPCILFIDEIEKGLSGVASSHATDGGTGARVFGTFLQWLNDRRSQVYVIATCNDISKLPPEFLRAERWDAIFFVDVPTAEEREQIWRIWLARYGLAEDVPRPKDEGWTGAEIRTCCRLAAVMGTTPAEAAKFVVPISMSMGEKISQLREWAKTRCIPASLSAPVRKAEAKKEEVSFV